MLNLFYDTVIKLQFQEGRGGGMSPENCEWLPFELNYRDFLLQIKLSDIDCNLRLGTWFSKNTYKCYSYILLHVIEIFITLILLFSIFALE